MGLSYKPARYSRGIGGLSGTLDGYRVFVDPDEQRKISLHFREERGVLLCNYARNQRPPSDLHRLYSGDRRFDAYFKTRYASEPVGERIRAYKQWAGLLDLVELEFRRELQQFNVTESGITLVFDFGNPPHIPAGAVEKLLRALVRMARVLEDGPEAA